jgi:hypothetical protein
VHEHGVAVADEGVHRVQLGAVEVFAGYMAGDGPVEFHALELADGVLLQPLHLPTRIWVCSGDGAEVVALRDPGLGWMSKVVGSV